MVSVNIHSTKLNFAPFVFQSAHESLQVWLIIVSCIAYAQPPHMQLAVEAEPHLGHSKMQFHGQPTQYWSFFRVHRGAALYFQPGWRKMLVHAHSGNKRAGFWSRLHGITDALPATSCARVLHVYIKFCYSRLSTFTRIGRPFVWQECVCPPKRLPGLQSALNPTSGFLFHPLQRRGAGFQSSLLHAHCLLGRR